MDKRFQSIKQMADKGYEPAGLVLKLFDIEHSDLKKSDRSAQIRLEQLAEQGNPAAQCLYAIYWNYQDVIDEKGQQWKKYVAQASDSGVAFCMHLRAVSLEKDNLKEKMRLMFEAAHKGDLFAQSGMSFIIEEAQAIIRIWPRRSAGQTRRKI